MSAPARVAIWMEGSHHPFAETADWLAKLFRSHGMQAQSADLDETLAGDADLVLLGGLVYRETPGYERPPRLAERLRTLRSRVPILAFHSVIGSWDDVPELDEFWDGRWNWATSRHSPIEPFRVRVVPGHPVVSGMADFETSDELYYNLREPRASRVLLEAEYEGSRWPLAWTRDRYVYCGLGHDVAALERPPVRDFLLRAAGYLLNVK